MRILITGGAGFMGSHMVRHFLRTRADVEIVNLDKLTYAGNLENLKDVERNPRYRFVHGDIADEKIVNDVMKDGVDVVLNYAAETHVDRSIMGPRSFLITEIIGTHTLLEAVQKYSVKRYVQISTDEVYGSVTRGESAEDAPFDPSNPYSAAKAGADHLCRAYWKTYSTPVVVTHSCNFFGPNQYPEKLLPLFITNLIEEKKVPLYGDGLNEREWIYTEDHCRAIDLILAKGVDGEVYNIGTLWRMNNKDLTKLLLLEFGCGEEMIEYVKDRPGHDRRYALDSTKLRALGWEPQGSLIERLKETIEWYRSNKAWWQKIKSGKYRGYDEQQYGTTD